MSKKTLFACITACLVSAVAQAGGVTDNEIVLGTHIDLSGPAAAGTAPIRYAMQMRFDEANEAGGVHGRKLRLIVEDNAGQPQMAVRAAQKLVREDDVFAMVNAFGTGTNAAVVKSVVDAGVLYFAPWANAGTMRSASGNSPLVFNTVQDYDRTTSFAVSWAIKTWNIKKIGVIYMEGPLGEQVKQGVKDGLIKDAQIVATASFKPGDIEFSSQVARMKAAGVKLLVGAGIVCEPMGIGAEVKKLGWNDVKILMALPAQTLTMARLGKDAVEGMYAVSSWVPYDTRFPTSAIARQRMDDYRKRFNTEPDEIMMAYAYADWFVKALEATGRELTTEKLVKSLKSMTFDDIAFWGPGKFDAENRLSPETIRVAQIRNGQWNLVSPTLTALSK